MTPAERGQLLWRLGDLMQQHLEELAELETLDQGKPLGVGFYAEIPGAIGQFHYFGGQASKIEGAMIPTSINYQPPGKQVFAYTIPQPVGVVAAIVPWNSPLVLTAMKLAPGARGRLHRRAEAGGGHLADRDPAGRVVRGGRFSARRSEYRHRAGQHHRGGAGPAQGRRQGGVYRLDGHRAARFSMRPRAT